MNDDKVKALQAELARAEKASKKAAERRGALGPGASRASLTSANAKWAQAAEYRDRIQRELDDAIATGSPA